MGRAQGRPKDAFEALIRTDADAGTDKPWGAAAGLAELERRRPCKRPQRASDGPAECGGPGRGARRRPSKDAEKPRAGRAGQTGMSKPAARPHLPCPADAVPRGTPEQAPWGGHAGRWPLWPLAGLVF